MFFLKTILNLRHSELLCWAEPFGFGPSAALNLFAPFLPSPRDFAGTAFTCDLQSSESFRRIIDCDTVQSSQGALRFKKLCENYKTTFIVSDFKAAEVSVAAGCKTVLYDPIPWFWRGMLPEVCHQVDAYICQDFFGVRKRLESEKIKNAHIACPLLPQKENPVKTSGILVNLGGLQNPFMHTRECQRFAQLILDHVAACSKHHRYSGFSSQAVVEGVRGHPFFTGKPEHLRKRLASSRLAFMTPGLGNIYDAAVLGDFVCFLPPTNDSQGQQLRQLQSHGLAPFSIDWHELLEGIDPIDYAGESQEDIMKTISGCFYQLLEDSRAKRRLEESIQSACKAAAKMDGLSYEPPLKKLAELFGGSRKAEEEVAAIVQRVTSQEADPLKPVPQLLFSPLSTPACNEDIDDPTSALKELHRELNGTGFHTLSYLMDFLLQVNKKYGTAPTKEKWQQSVAEFNPDPAALLTSYGASYCTPLAEILIERARNELGIEGQIVYVDYRDSKRPLHRVWPKYQGPVHVDAVFQYRRRGTMKDEAIHIVCGLGLGSSRFKHFFEIEDHHRFLMDGNYRVNALEMPTDIGNFYRDVLCRWNFVEIVKGPKVNRKSSRFSVDMIRGTMTLNDAGREETIPLDRMLECGKKEEAFLTYVQYEFAQPEKFIDSMLVLSRLRNGFCKHVLMDSCSHLEGALRKLKLPGLKAPTQAIELALENFLDHPSFKKTSSFLSYFFRAYKIWLGMQAKAPHERDLQTLLLQSAVMLNHHVVIHREAILEKRTPIVSLLQERFALLPKRESLMNLAAASGVYPTDDECSKFVESMQQILLDHLLLGFIEAGITLHCSKEELKSFEENFTSLLDTQSGISAESKEALFALLRKMLQLGCSPQGKMQIFLRQETAPDQIEQVESYYWENIPVRASLRELPQATRAFSVAAQVSVFEDSHKLKAVLQRHYPRFSPNKESAALILDSLFNREIIALVQRYAGVGLGPQMTALCLDAAERCGMEGLFQSEVLVGFKASKSCMLAQRIAHQPILRRALAKHCGLPLSLDKEALLNILPPEIIVNFFRSRFFGQFIASEDADLLDILAKLITSDPEPSSSHQRPSLQRRVDRALFETTTPLALQAALTRLRQSIQQLATHPFGPQVMETEDWARPLDSFDLIEELQCDVDNMVQVADRLWDEKMRRETGGCLTQEMKQRFAYKRYVWVQHELPYYEPNCAISVIPHTFEPNEHERKFLAFFEKVRIFWQDPFAIARVLQRLTCLLEILQQESGIGRVAVLQQLLEKAEREMEFNDVVDLDKGFSQSEFYEVLRGGHPFNDLIFLSQPHGSRVHRLQWLLLYLQYLHAPQDLGLTENTPPGFLGAAYRQLGDEKLIKKLGYPLSQTMEDIWRLLFDNLHQRNFSCADHVMRVMREQLGFDPDEVNVCVVQNRKKEWCHQHQT